MKYLETHSLFSPLETLVCIAFGICVKRIIKICNAILFLIFYYSYRDRNLININDNHTININNISSKKE